MGVGATVIRVIRVIEYEYQTDEAMARDMERWTLKSPGPNWGGTTMTSAVLRIQHIDNNGEKVTE